MEAEIVPGSGLGCVDETQHGTWFCVCDKHLVRRCGGTGLCRLLEQAQTVTRIAVLY